ncbi:MAG: hypothetical protein LBS41_03985 [Streptococcaceae bacterium]|nr:hypothetical protein [Streptococcaceae bacterium]
MATAAAVQDDITAWDKEIKPVTGATDLFVYPFGQDIHGVENYSNEKFKILYQHGFRFFFNVDASKPAWVQLHQTYIRQARRNLDGYRLWHDLIDPNHQLLGDLFNTADIFDQVRPIPVPDVSNAVRH